MVFSRVFWERSWIFLGFKEVPLNLWFWLIQLSSTRPFDAISGCDSSVMTSIA